MSRRFASLTEEEQTWLRANSDARIGQIAKKLGICTDSAKRWLIRLGLKNTADYPGAKYAVAVSKTSKNWNRPCSRCKSTARRPRWQYYCDPCKTALNHEAGENPFDIAYVQYPA